MGWMDWNQCYCNLYYKSNLCFNFQSKSKEHIPLFLCLLSGPYAPLSILPSCPQLRMPLLNGLECCSGYKITGVRGDIYSGREKTRQPFFVAHLSSQNLPCPIFLCLGRLAPHVPLGHPLTLLSTKQWAGGPPVPTGHLSARLPVRLSFISGMCCNTRVSSTSEIITSHLLFSLFSSPFSSCKMIKLPDKPSLPPGLVRAQRYLLLG